MKYSISKINDVKLNSYTTMSILSKDSLISSLSRDTLSTNETHGKGNFDDWYIIIFINLGFFKEFAI